jgi:dynein heavy chain, axonemal
MRKFLTQTRFVMEDTLRTLVEESLARFTTFIKAAAGTKVVLLPGQGPLRHLWYG